MYERRGGGKGRDEHGRGGKKGRKKGKKRGVREDEEKEAGRQ